MYVSLCYFGNRVSFRLKGCHSVEISVIKSLLCCLVCPDTESSMYTDAFYESRDVIVNALDNVEARRYVDRWVLSHQVE